MAHGPTCPQCGAAAIKLEEYRALMVLSNTRAMFTVRCGSCNRMVSVFDAIPITLQEEVQQAALEVNAGMGRSLT